MVGVVGRDEDLAVPTERFRSEGTVAAELDGRPITAWNLPGTASPLQHDTVGGGDEIGATGVFYAARLERITHLDTFWFAWSSYRPETTLLS